MIAWLEEHGHGERRDHLPAARLAVQPAALLGRAVPDRLRRDRRCRSRCPTRCCRSSCPRWTTSRRAPSTPTTPTASPETPLSRNDGLGRGRAGPGRRAEAVHPRDQHDAATGPAPAGTSCATWTRTTTRRSVDPENEALLDGPAAPTATRGGVDLYVGGVEHAVLHLLYARFWHKVLFDLGHVSSFEPFRRLFNQGYIQAYAYRDDRGMVVPAEEVVERDGRATSTATSGGQPRVRQDGQVAEERGDARTRCARRTAPTRSGSTRWRWARWTSPGRGRPARSSARSGSCSGSGGWWSTRRPARSRVVRRAAGRRRPRRLLHRIIDGVRDRHGRAAVQHGDRQADRADQRADPAGRPAPREAVEPLVLMLAPFAPHIAEELWQRLGHDGLAGVRRLPGRRPGAAGGRDDHLPGAGQRQGPRPGRGRARTRPRTTVRAAALAAVGAHWTAGSRGRSSSSRAGWSASSSELSLGGRSGMKLPWWAPATTVIPDRVLPWVHRRAGLVPSGRSPSMPGRTRLASPSMAASSRHVRAARRRTSPSCTRRTYRRTEVDVHAGPGRSRRRPRQLRRVAGRSSLTVVPLGVNAGAPRSLATRHGGLLPSSDAGATTATTSQGRLAASARLGSGDLAACARNHRRRLTRRTACLGATRTCIYDFPPLRSGRGRLSTTGSKTLPHDPKEG